MRLTAGTRVGPYEVLALLGAGGMAEVYRAKDTRLGRDVAIKVVSEALGTDGALLERFEREAKLAGSLNHPNVVALHDVGLHDGKPYFVTELLQGESLRERLAKGPVPVGKGLEWAAQMAQGLAAAHERGIIHRDLKPENVFITRDGHVKLLDFGIAKLIEVVHEATPHDFLDETVSPSGSSTGTGMVLGTPGYMSPEQVRGDPVDARTDFFSLGTVVYEMLSGRRAFPGPVVESGYAILHYEPEPLPAAVPASVAQVVGRCLEKDAGRRFQSARDLAFNLELLRGPSGSVGAAVQTSSTRRWRPAWWLLPLVGGAAIGLIAIVFRFAAPVRRDAVFSVRMLTFRSGSVTAARFGPDSRTVYFSASWNGEPEQVYSTTTDNPDYHSLGIEEMRLEAVSPSGELAVLLHPKASGALGEATGTLARVPGVGGVPREVADNVANADWAPDGVNMVITRKTAGGFRVEYPIGNTVYESNRPLGVARLSPTGRRIALVEFAMPHDMRGDVVVIEPGRPKRVVIENWEYVLGLAWTPGGDELLFGGLPLGIGQQPSLWATSLGGKVRLLHAGADLYLDDIAKDGRALVRQKESLLDVGVMSLAQKKANAHLGWFDEPFLGAISTDGRSILLQEANMAGVAFGAINGGGAYWAFLQRTDGSPPVRLGPGRPLDLSQDGKWALTLDQTGHPNRVWLLPTGSGTSRKMDFTDLSFTTEVGWFGFLLPDARGAILPVQRPEGVRAYIVDLQSGQGRAMTAPLLPWAVLSPDRRFFAATSLDGGVAAYPVPEGSQRVVRGVGPDDLLVAWTNRGLLVVPDGRLPRGLTPPVTLFRVDPETGTRETFATIGLGDAPSADALIAIAVTPDEKTVAYSYERHALKLYLYDFGSAAAEPPRNR